MKYFCIALVLIAASASAQKKKPDAQKTQQEIIKSIDANYEKYSNIAHKIWEFAEVGYQEEKSSALLQETLKQAGFTIETGVAGIPTAFVASFGSGKPVIGILGEYDALPGVSQDAVPEVKQVPDRPAGHACGHHLFGTDGYWRARIGY